MTTYRVTAALNQTSQPLRMQVVGQVLAAAKDNNDELVIAACRRLIEAERLGWRRHANAADWALVAAFA